ncbi:MAG TPA: sigma-70 family RNA polymerase sigma factor [Stellaceae bacterium]|nr:sigma-70 family RNA polymerase sigma factor [Stellaceae bacterium]
MNAALDRSIRQYTTDLRRYARALVGRTGEADELVQECLVRAIARTRLWARIRNPRAYLFAIMHNAYVDWLAGRRRQQRYIELQLAVHAGDACAEPQTVAVETKDLERALSYLPNEQREVVLMVGLEGMSYQQTADALDIPVGTVMSRLSRGRATLRHLTDGKKRMPVLPASVAPARRSHLRIV